MTINSRGQKNVLITNKFINGIKCKIFIFINKSLRYFKKPEIEFYNKHTNNDKWVVNEIFPKKRGGFFVECGAVRGIFGSSCYTLEKFFNWKGICIEANPIHIQHLANNRNSVIVNAILSDERKNDHLFIYFKDAEQRSMAIKDKIEYDELIIKLKNEYTSPNISDERKLILKKLLGPSELIKIPSFTLLDILKKYNAPKIIDYLAMDIEGYEYNVLKCFPFDEYKILAISIEGGKCNDLLISRGYKLVKNSYNITKSFEKYFIHKDYEYL